LSLTTEAKSMEPQTNRAMGGIAKAEISAIPPAWLSRHRFKNFPSPTLGSP
jgi:hypothetical protein